MTGIVRAIAATWLLAAAACLASCDALVGPDYSGEPLVRLQAVVLSTYDGGAIAGDSPESGRLIGAKGAVLWQAASMWGLTGFTRLPVRLDLPVFSIEVIAEPRSNALFQIDPGEPAIAEAYLHMVKPETGSMPRADDFFATDYEHALIYAGGEVPPGGATAAYLGGSLGPGFHVVVRSPVTELPPWQRMLVERCVAAAQVPPEEARAACTAQRMYRLDPAPDDLATLLRFHVELPGT